MGCPSGLTFGLSIRPRLSGRARAIFLPLSVLLLVAGGVAHAQVRPQGESLRPLRAQLHVHTLASFRGEPNRDDWLDAFVSGLGRVKEEAGEFDHAKCWLPANTLRNPLLGLDVIGFSDHAHELSAHEWDVLLDDQLSSGASRIVPLRGFEWSPDRYWHINVFGTSVPAYVSKSSVWSCPHTAVGQKVLRKPIIGLVTVPVTEAGGGYPSSWHNSGSAGEVARDPRRAFRDLAAWITSQSRGAVVCQINHPHVWDRTDGGESGLDILLNDAELRQAVGDEFALMEVGGGPDVPFFYAPLRVIQGELYYRQALTAGWRVAPAIGIDNQTGALLDADDAYTVVFVPENCQASAGSVAAALRQRRTAATEIAGLVPWFELTAAGQSQFMGGQLTAIAGSDVRALLELGPCPGSPKDYNAELIQVQPGGCSELAMARQADGSFAVRAPVDGETICYYVRIERGSRMALTAPVWIKVIPAPTPMDAAPITLALVMDRSGSMGWERKLSQAQEAAATLVQRLPDGSRAGLSWFSGSADVGHPLVDVGSIRSEAGLTAAIDSLDARDATNIGAGLQRGLEMLRASPDDSPRRCLLMSDGCNNTEYSNEQVLAMASGSPWPIDAVAYGSDADRQLLAQLAHNSGGYAMPADTGSIVAVYDRIGAMARGYSVTAAYSQLMQGGNRVRFPFSVPACASQARVAVDWAGGAWSGAACDVELRLTRPDGTVLTGSEVTTARESTHSAVAVNLAQPRPGEWEIEVR